MKVGEGVALSDLHLFGLLKEALRERRFSCDDVKAAVVHQWLHAQPKAFFFFLADDAGKCDVVCFEINRFKNNCRNLLNTPRGIHQYGLVYVL